VQVVFRADASAAGGIGHVMRCLALAEALSGYGVRSAFVAYGLAPVTRATIRDAGHALLLGSEPVAPQRWMEDARTTIGSLAALSERPTWIVVDNYALDGKWEREIRSTGARIAVVDDLANRHHECDLLVDQTARPGKEGRYHALVPDHCALLLGPRYAMLRREFEERRNRTSPRSARLKRLLISYGGSDPTGETLKAVAAVLSVPNLTLQVDVVAGVANPRANEIQAACSADARLRFYPQLDRMAESMAEADLAIGACGMTSWERCALYLPALATIVTDNQRAIGGTLSAMGAVKLLGWHDLVTSDTIAAVLSALANNPELLSRMSQAAGAVTDGAGAGRIAEAMLDTALDLCLRPATMEDRDLLLRWRNDPETRANSHDTLEVHPQQHADWLQQVLSDAKRQLLIAEASAVPIGVIRADYDEKAGCHRLSWTVAPEARRRGLGARMVRMMVSRLSGPVLAEVKEGNSASRRIAEMAGLQLQEVRHGVMYFSRA
jgi:UDP-2,4-diacetamido-2,4,6-trideoxy-beta-L-altropyranose hydrolase